MSDGRQGLARRAILFLSLLAILLSAVADARPAFAGVDTYADFSLAWTAETPNDGDGDDVPGVRLHDGCCIHHTQLPTPAVHRVAPIGNSSIVRTWHPQSADRPAPPSRLTRPPKA